MERPGKENFPKRELSFGQRKVLGGKKTNQGDLGAPKGTRGLWELLGILAPKIPQEKISKPILWETQCLNFGPKKKMGTPKEEFLGPQIFGAQKNLSHCGPPVWPSLGTRGVFPKGKPKRGFLEKRVWARKTPARETGGKNREFFYPNFLSRNLGKKTPKNFWG